MKLVHRAGAALAAGALVLTTAGSAQAAAVDTSADWLDRQLTNGLVVGSFESQGQTFTYDDYGLTADTALALKAIGGHGTQLRQIRDALAPHVDDWTTDGQGGIYSASVAKAVVTAQVTGADPRSFGGRDLVTRLHQRMATEAPIVGRIRDDLASGDDFANTIGQSFAARGLAVAGSRKAGPATTYLLKQQCSKGFFRLSFAKPTAARQGCDAGSATTSAPDTDVTALAVLNLQAIPRKSRAVKTAISEATTWLKRTQKTNGSFGGGTATEASNSNSTGLASWARGSIGACRPAAKAAGWVRGLTVRGDVSGTPLEGEQGAIAYNGAGYRAAQVDGITVEAQDQWRRATSQAAPALANLSAATCAAR